jgi:methylglyoxal synthase
VLYNIPTACNRATADFVVSSHLMDVEYPRIKAAHEPETEDETTRPLR